MVAAHSAFMVFERRRRSNCGPSARNDDNIRPSKIEIDAPMIGCFDWLVVKYAMLGRRAYPNVSRCQDNSILIGKKYIKLLMPFPSPRAIVVIVLYAPQRFLGRVTADER